MPSPFPGMDPFIEDQEWDDFQATFHVVASELLAPAIEPKYLARIKRQEYSERQLPKAIEYRESYLVIR